MTDTATATPKVEIVYNVVRTRTGDQLHTSYLWKLAGETEFRVARNRTGCGARVARVLEPGTKIQVRPGLLGKKCFDGLKREYIRCELIEG